MNKNHLHLFNHPLWHGEPNKLARLLLWVWSVPSDCDHNLDWWPWCSGGLWWSQCGHNIYICWLGWWEITDFTEVDEHRVIWLLAREWKQTLAMKHTQDFLPAQGCRPAPSDTPEKTWLFASVISISKRISMILIATLPPVVAIRLAFANHSLSVWSPEYLNSSGCCNRSYCEYFENTNV